MNSLDAIIALCALLFGFAIILGAINEQKGTVENTNNSTSAKTNALQCRT
jgi:hypothetical protein